MGIIKDIETFFSKFIAAFKKLFGELPSWLTVAQKTLEYVAPLVVTALTLAGGPAIGTEAQSIIDSIKFDLATAYSASTSIGGAPNMVAALQSVQSNLPAFLTAVRVSNPNTVADVEKYVTIIDNELTAILSTAKSAGVTGA